MTWRAAERSRGLTATHVAERRRDKPSRRAGERTGDAADSRTESIIHSIWRLSCVRGFGGGGGRGEGGGGVGGGGGGGGGGEGGGGGGGVLRALIITRRPRHAG